jgi:hypothetical protein
MQALGLAVALSGDGLTMIAASRGASNVGQVHVYAYVNSLWIVQGVLPAPGAQFSFGGSLALSSTGEFAAVGEPWTSSFGASNGGAVRVFNTVFNITPDPADGIPATISWSESASIEGTAEGAHYGTYLDIDTGGNVLLASNAGVSALADVSVLDYDSATGVWQPRENTFPGEEPSMQLIVLSADGLVAVAVCDLGEDIGFFYRFVWTDEAWAQSGTSQDLDFTNGFLRISGDGSVLAISEFGYGNGFQGRLRVFRWADDTWVQMATAFEGNPPLEVFDQDPRAADWLGVDTQVSGTRVAFSQIASHQASVYDFDAEENAWILVGHVIALRNHENDTMFRFALGLAGDRLVVAEQGYNLFDSSPAVGSITVYLFAANVWTVSATLASGLVFPPWFDMLCVSADGNVVVAASVAEDETVSVVSYVWQPEARDPTWNTYDVALGTAADNMTLSSDGTTVALAETSLNAGAGRVTTYRRDGGSAIPCFHGDTIIALADGTVVRVADMAAGMVVRDIHGRAQAVRRVIRRQQADCVYFQPDALAPGVPNRTLLVTPNHLLRHPDGRVMPAGALVAALEEMQTRRAVRVRAGGARVMHRSAARCGRILQPLTVYHIAVDRWSLVRVHNLWAETMVQTVADDRRRRQCVRQ